MEGRYRGDRLEIATLLLADHRCISPASPLHLPFIFPVSPLHLPHISRISPGSTLFFADDPDVIQAEPRLFAECSSVRVMQAPGPLKGLTLPRILTLTLNLSLTLTLAVTLTRPPQGPRVRLCSGADPSP